MNKPIAYLPFAEPRTYIVPHHHSDTLNSLDSVFASQGDYRPTYVHVGIDCSDEQLRALWEARTRYLSITLKQLKAARNRFTSRVGRA